MEAACRDGALAKRIGALSEDTVCYAMQRQDPAPIFALGCRVARRLKRNGILRSDWARGRTVAAVDGIEICSSFVRCCSAWIERKVERHVDGQLRQDIQYYHRLVAVVVVSAPFPVPLGVRFQNKGESEVACATALLHELERQLGRRFVDVLVGDALYLQTGFVRQVESLHWEWACSIKENQPELLGKAQRLTAGPPEMTESGQQQELRLWHAPEVYWPVADRSVRVIKTVRLQKRNRTQVSSDGPTRKKNKEVLREESTNYYATNLELGSIPARFVHELGRSRWRIDTEVFQTLTTQTRLKQPSVHRDRALVVLTMIRVLAYTLSLVFYHRQVVSHARRAPPSFSEMARLLAALLSPPRLDSS